MFYFVKCLGFGSLQVIFEKEDEVSGKDRVLSAIRVRPGFGCSTSTIRSSAALAATVTSPHVYPLANGTLGPSFSFSSSEQCIVCRAPSRVVGLTPHTTRDTTVLSEGGIMTRIEFYYHRNG